MKSAPAGHFLHLFLLVWPSACYFWGTPIIALSLIYSAVYIHICSLMLYGTSMVSNTGICKLLFSSLGAVSCLTPLDSIYLAVSLLYFTALLVFHFQSVAHEQTLEDCSLFWFDQDMHYCSFTVECCSMYPSNPNSSWSKFKCIIFYLHQNNLARA